MTLLPIFIHIGYPKTGTTWLQTRVFPKLQHVKYVTEAQSVVRSLNHSGGDIFIDNYLDFCALFALYETLFGVNSIWVKTYEKLSNKLQAFIKVMGQFIEEEFPEISNSLFANIGNRDLSEGMMKTMRRHNLIVGDKICLSYSNFRGYALRNVKRLDEMGYVL